MDSTTAINAINVNSAIVTELAKKKDCKGSVCFETKDVVTALSSVYINRSFAAINNAQRVRITIEVIA